MAALRGDPVFCNCAADQRSEARNADAGRKEATNRDCDHGRNLSRDDELGARYRSGPGVIPAAKISRGLRKFPTDAERKNWSKNRRRQLRCPRLPRHRRKIKNQIRKTKTKISSSKRTINKKTISNNSSSRRTSKVPVTANNRNRTKNRRRQLPHPARV